MKELRDFHRFLGDQLASGDTGVTPEQCLELWRAEHPRDDDLEDDIRAVQEALTDMEAGDTGQPFEAFLAGFRAQRRPRS